MAGRTVYRGQTSGDVDVWRGIRYATPPTGDLRWRRARPLEPESGTVDATAFGAVAPQEVNPGVPMSPDAIKSEDCLFLNVWAPSGAAGDGRRLPVMVWIHGGAYVFGAGTQPIYDGAHLASTQNIVVVTLNYRLGALGFADLGAGGSGAGGVSDSAAGGRYETNAALSDVLTALRWVADTIDAFGGDPDNVTVAGESAGGGIVTTLLTMPLARGLFHRAVAQSSPVTSVYDRARAAYVAERLTAAVGGTCGDIDSFAALDTDKVVAATMKAFTGVPAAHPGTIPFSPVVDGDLVPRHPIDVYRDGESLPIPLLIGTNRDEAALFKFMKSPLMPIAEPAIMQMFTAIATEYPEVSIPTAERVAAAYPGTKAKSMGLDVARDMAFRMPTVWAAEGHAGVPPSISIDSIGPHGCCASWGFARRMPPRCRTCSATFRAARQASSSGSEVDGSASESPRTCRRGGVRSSATATRTPVSTRLRARGRRSPRTVGQRLSSTLTTASSTISTGHCVKPGETRS